MRNVIFMRYAPRSSLTLCTFTLCTLTAFAHHFTSQEIASEAIKTTSIATIYPAKTVITMDSELSTAEAVAVINDKIVAVESLSDVKAKVGNKNFVIDNRFKDQVTVPGLIDQHIYPLLSALTMTSEIIAM